MTKVGPTPEPAPEPTPEAAPEPAIESAEDSYRCGVEHRGGKRYREAIAELDRAVQLRPRYPAALTERGLAHCEAGHHGRALADYDAALRIDPACALALENKGSLLLILQKPRAALPLLDRALRLRPDSLLARYHRGAARMMLGERDKAWWDFSDVAASEEESFFCAKARQWMQRIGEGDPAKRPGPLAEFLWTEHVTLTLDHTVAQVVAAVQKREAYQVVLSLAGDGFTALSVYRTGGLRDRLTELADLVGEELLALRLHQLLGPLAPCTPIGPRTPLEEVTQAVAASGGQTVLMDKGQLLGVIAVPPDYGYPEGPTALFGPRPDFGRQRQPPSKKDARRCTGCERELAYYRPVLAGGRLDGLACPACGLDPVPDWIEQRMQPGRWSRGGFLAEGERVRDVIERDAGALETIRVTHAQLADALESLLTLASRRDKERISAAQLDSLDEMVHRGQRSHDDVAILELAPSFDAVTALLERGELPPEDQGLVAGDLQIFLRVYVGYQSCPWTILRRPYSADEAPWKMMEISGAGYRALSPQLGEELSCSGGVSFSHGDRDFLLLNRRTRAHVRGAGMMPHLIRDHRFFEGPRSPYRLDPEQLARVLGLCIG